MGAAGQLARAGSTRPALDICFRENRRTLETWEVGSLLEELSRELWRRARAEATVPLTPPTPSQSVAPRLIGVIHRPKHPPNLTVAHPLATPTPGYVQPWESIWRRAPWHTSRGTTAACMSPNTSSETRP